MKRYTPFLISFLSGALLTLAFAPFHLWPLAILLPAIFLYLQIKSPQKAALIGFTFGLGFFGTSIYWVFISIHIYGASNAILAALLTLGFVALLAVAPTIQAYLLAKLFPTNNVTKLLLGFPCTWVFSEWLRSWLFTGFPWVLLGYSQSTSPLRGLAPILGEFGVSLVLCFMAGLLVLAMHKRRLVSASSIAAIFIASYLLTLVPWTHPYQKPVSVSLLQGNVAQSFKWSAKALEDSKKLYRHMTMNHLNAKLIIWPESAITAPPWYEQAYLKDLSEQAKAHDSTVIVGLPVSTPQAPDRYLNGLLAIGQGSGEYFKRHLVPFGEYVPLERWLRKLQGFFDLPMSNLQPGPKHQAFIQTAGIQFAPFICYEIAYAGLVYPGLANAQALITISDDSWFGHSTAAAQHLQIGQWRAIETRRPMLFVSNSGATAIIDANGTITQQLPMFTRASLDANVQATSGITPIMRYGKWPFLVLIGIILLAALLMQIMRKINAKD